MFLWSQFEEILNEVSYRCLQKTSRARGVYVIVEYLYQRQLVNKVFVSEFDELRQIRNLIAHGRYRSLDLSADTRELLIERLQKLIEKVESILDSWFEPPETQSP